MTILGTWRPGSDEWLEARRFAIGGSEIATVCGLSPWMTREALLAEKLGETERRKSSDAMNRGTFLEAGIADWVAFEKGLVYDDAASAATWQHPEYPWAIANPDRVTVDGLLVEIKTVANRDTDNGWGRAGTDEVPLLYAAQVQYQLGVMGLEKAWLVVLHGATNGRPDLSKAIYKLTAKPDLFARLIAAGAAFIEELNARARGKK